MQRMRTRRSEVADPLDREIHSGLSSEAHLRPSWSGYMRPYFVAFTLLTILTLSAGSVSACSCGEIKPGTLISTGPAPNADEVAKWRQQQTDYALFTGEVVKIEKTKVKQSKGSNDESPLKKVTVKVESYWLGVTQAKMIIYTGIGGGDCGVPYQRGRRYLFWASRNAGTQLLETDICGPTAVNDKIVNDFDEVFGKSKSIL